jgi:hypothetical protein
MRRDNGIEPGLHGFQTTALGIIAGRFGDRVDPADEKAQPAGTEFQVETAQETDIKRGCPALGQRLRRVVEAMGAGYIGEFTDLCQAPWIASMLTERCADGGNFVLFGSNYQDVFAFLVLIAVLIFRPSGLLGERVSDRA